MSNSGVLRPSGPKSPEGSAMGHKKSTGREWSPRFWTGMNFSAWWRLLARNRFAVGWRFWPHVVLITLGSLFHSAYRRWHWFWKGRHAAKVEIRHEPLFIVGHWRAGTTLLHELLVLDERHTSPTTYECLVPNHFLLSEDFARRWLTFLLPAHRPMDNMPAGWDRPQEDEFALCNLGLPSPYLRIAFPNHPPQDTEYLTLEGIPADDLARWKSVFLGFLRQITYRTPKRIVLKSPPHTCRIKTLLELFPAARFIHIVRDPFVLFPSTMNLWKTLYKRHGLQEPTFEGLEEHVFETFERMYRRFETDRELIAADRFCEVRYEDLVRDPIGNLRTIYEKLGLGEFENVLPALEDYVDATQGYKTNEYVLTPDLRDEISRRWIGYIRRYGYEERIRP
ncbi:MAG TPA: sulfotransferase [Pirellulales bacterium]|nr:sulfotransferase [Pirellulales bacterium]